MTKRRGGLRKTFRNSSGLFPCLDSFDPFITNCILSDKELKAGGESDETTAPLRKSISKPQNMIKGRKL